MKHVILLFVAFCVVKTSSSQLLPEQFTGQPIHSFPGGNLNSFQSPDNILSVITLLASNGTSVNARAPQGAQRYIKTVYLITGAELAAAGAPSGFSPNLVGFSYAGGQSISTTSTTFKIFLFNQVGF